MHVGILGAGAIGCTVGGRLALGGAAVTLIGRPRVARTVASGITLSRWGAPTRVVPPRAFRFTDDPAALASCDVVLVTVKSADTATAASQLHRVLPDRVPVASLQNGVDNPQTLAVRLPDRPIWPGVVPFNVIRDATGRFHQGTSGTIVVPRAARPLVDQLRAGGAPAVARRDVRAVQWGKLLLNLNNAVNALLGVPLRDQLLDPRIRALLAAVIDEGRTVLSAHRIRVRGIGLLQPALAPRVLRLPSPWFERVARSMISIDPEARSSMQDDLRRGRHTEVAALNGRIVTLGAAAGVSTPRNAALVHRVQAASGAGDTPSLSAEELLAALA